MSKHYTSVLMAVGLALAFGSTARADDSGGDNSMSQWTGESYAAFHRGEVGDFYTDPSEVASDEPADATTDNVKTQVAGAPPTRSTARNPFRDDTAA